MVVSISPKGSETGMETTASPNIWSDTRGFTALLEIFQTDTAAGILKAEEVEFFDKDAFGAVFGKATTKRKSCHQEYRIKK